MMNDMDNSNKKKKSTKLRSVMLRDVAKYLECDPKRLCIALKHLAETPSMIKYGRSCGDVAAIGPAQLAFDLIFPDEVAELESMYKKPDKRKQTKAA